MRFVPHRILRFVHKRNFPSEVIIKGDDFSKIFNFPGAVLACAKVHGDSFVKVGFKQPNCALDTDTGA
jgi:hypothetical protein